MNGELPSLDLAVVTHRPEGIHRVAQMVLPPADGIRYVVSWQDHRDAPVPDSLVARPDVEIYRFDGRGISSNRNNALTHCQADIVLFSDDDLVYRPEDLIRLRQLYQEKRDVDVATLISIHGDMSRFPKKETRLTTQFPEGYSVASFEISFRRTSGAGLRCCPELGLGSEKLHGGEDEMFLFSAVKRGLDCRFFPITICEHPNESTGTKAHCTRENLMASGCVIALTYPWTACLRVPLKAWRVWRSGRAPAWTAISSLVRGALMAPGVLKRNHDSLW